MESLPQEIKYIICTFLKPAEVLGLSLCNTSWCHIANSVLYPRLDIHFEQHKIPTGTQKLIESFAGNPALCQNLRTIQVTEENPRSVSTEAVKVLQIILRIIIRHARITTFQWRLSQDADLLTIVALPSGITDLAVQRLTPHSNRFTSLSKLDYRRVRSIEDELCVCWHATNCSQLRSLALHGRLIPRSNPLAVLMSNDNHLLSRLQDLSLECFNIVDLRIDFLLGLERLELKRCSGTREVLRNSMTKDKSLLKSLSLTTIDDCTQEIHDYLTWLSHRSSLNELVILSTGLTALPISLVLLHAKTLKYLVIESRKYIGSPSTANLYSIDDFRKLTQSCVHLVALGIALEVENILLRNESSNRRSDLWKYIYPKCYLQVLHLRLERSRQKAEVDAKHAVRSFLIRNPPISATSQDIIVHVGHAQRRRAFRLRPKSPGDKEHFAKLERTSNKDHDFVIQEWNLPSKLGFSLS